MVVQLQTLIYKYFLKVTLHTAQENVFPRFFLKQNGVSSQ